MERKLERYCKDKDKNLIFWGLLSSWVDELMNGWTREWMSLWVDKFVSWCAWELFACELMWSWVDELVNPWVDKFLNLYVGELICLAVVGFSWAISQWVDLWGTSYMGRVLILCWASKRQQTPHNYRNNKSRDCFNVRSGLGLGPNPLLYIRASAKLLSALCAFRYLCVSLPL